MTAQDCQARGLSNRDHHETFAPTMNSPKNSLHRNITVVHWVHGTFPRGLCRQLVWNLAAPWRWWRAQRGHRVEDVYPRPHRHPRRRHWFEEGSEFESAIRQRLGPEAEHYKFERFKWSGNNSWKAREVASIELRRHLEASQRRRPEADHLVIAHSHGGTVAVNALDLAPTGCGERTVAILTLATPFVRLALRHRINRLPQLGTVLAVLLPIWLLLAAPLLAVDLLLRGESIPWLAWTLLAAGLVALFTRRVVMACVVVIATFAFAGVAVRSDVPALLIALLLPAFGLVAWDRPPFDFVSQVKKYLRPSLRLPCALTAIRLPSDEASLVIGAAQTVGRLFELVYGALGRLIELLFKPFSWPAGESTGRRIARTVFGTSWLIVLGLVLLYISDAILGLPARGWGERLVLSVGVPGFFLIPITIVLGFLWLIPAALLSLATGPEALLLPFLSTVHAEPLPFAEPPEAMRLEIDYEAGTGNPGLYHSLHQVEKIRASITAWILSPPTTQTLNRRQDGPH